MLCYTYTSDLGNGSMDEAVLILFALFHKGKLRCLVFAFVPTLGTCLLLMMGVPPFDSSNERLLIPSLISGHIH